MSEKIYDSLTQLVGKTPLVRLHGFEKLHGLKAHILAKVEYFNPIGSIKDRIVLRIIEDAEKKAKSVRKKQLCLNTPAETQELQFRPSVQ